MSQGFLGFLGLAKETTWGTAIAASDYLELMSENITTTIDRFPTRNIFNGFYEPDDYAGLRHSAGAMVHAGHPVSLGHLLKAVFNTMSGSTVLSGFLYQSIFVGTKSEFADGVPRQPYTLEINRNVTSSHRYAGALCSKLTMALAPNQPLMITTDWIAQAQTMLAATTPTYPTSSTNPFTFDTASLQLAGVANTRLEALTLSIDNGLEGIAALNNSNTIARIRAKDLQLIRVNGTLDFIDIAEQQDFINQTERAMILSLTQASSFQLLMTIPRFVYTAFPNAMPGRGRLTVAFQGMARYQVSSAASILMQLTSTKSNY